MNTFVLGAYLDSELQFRLVNAFAKISTDQNTFEKAEYMIELSGGNISCGNRAITQWELGMRRIMSS
jgi:hypothetical protein